MRDISVITSTYNTITFLIKTLNSLSKQTLDRSLSEIIVVDDGSTDGTSSVIDQYSSKFPIRYFHPTPRLD